MVLSVRARLLHVYFLAKKVMDLAAEDGHWVVLQVSEGEGIPLEWIYRITNSGVDSTA